MSGIADIQSIDGMIVVSADIPDRAAFSLNGFVFSFYKPKPETIEHERGHYRQQQILGPLYLPVIGSLSLVSATIGWFVDFPLERFYALPWETWGL